MYKIWPRLVNISMICHDVARCILTHFSTCAHVKHILETLHIGFKPFLKVCTCIFAVICKHFQERLKKLCWLGFYSVGVCSDPLMSEADLDLTPYKGRPSIKQTNHWVCGLVSKCFVYCIKDEGSNKSLAEVQAVGRYCVTLASSVGCWASQYWLSEEASTGNVSIGSCRRICDVVMQRVEPARLKSNTPSKQFCPIVQYATSPLHAELLQHCDINFHLNCKTKLHTKRNIINKGFHQKTWF